MFYVSAFLKTKNNISTIHDARFNICISSEIRVVGGNNARREIDARHGPSAPHRRGRQLQTGTRRTGGQQPAQSRQGNHAQGVLGSVTATAGRKSAEF